MEEEKKTLSDVVGYLVTLSMYQIYCQTNGQDAGQELLSQFVKKWYAHANNFFFFFYNLIINYVFSRCLTILDAGDKQPEEVEIVIKRKWFLLMGRKL